MKCRVTILDQDNEIISNDYWYGHSLKNIKYWVDLAIKDIIGSNQYDFLHYVIEVPE